jgi:hypothetical protein
MSRHLLDVPTSQLRAFSNHRLYSCHLYLLKPLNRNIIARSDEGTKETFLDPELDIAGFRSKTGAIVGRTPAHC